VSVRYLGWSYDTIHGYHFAINDSVNQVLEKSMGDFFMKDTTKPQSMLSYLGIRIIDRACR